MTNESSKRKFVFRPFISSNSLRIIAIILLMTGQIATMFLVYNKVNFIGEESEEKLLFLKNLTTVAMPLFLTGVITNILRHPQKIKKTMLFYFVLSVVFVVGEILFFYFVFVPFVEELVKYMLETEGETSAEAHEIVTFLLRYTMSNFSNLNVFLDLFVTSAIAFFVLYTPKNAAGKKLVLFRCGVALPLLYIVASFVLSGLFRKGYFSMNIEATAFLTHKNYLCFTYFIGIIIYQKYRSKIYERFNKEEPFEEYKRSAKGLYLYNAMSVLFLAALCGIDFLLGLLVPGAKSFYIGKSYVSIFALPLLMFFNSERKVHNVTANVISGVLYALFGFVLFVGYTVILDRCMEYAQAIITIIKIFIR